MPIWEEEEGIVKSRNWVGPFITWFPIIFAAIFWLVFHNRIGFKTIDVATLVFFGVVSAYMLIRLPEQAFLNASPKFVFANGHDTTTGEFYTAGNFAVVTRGIKAWEVYHSFNSPVYIMPSDSLVKKGKNLIASALLALKTIEEVPPAVQELIIEKNLQPPYYVGYADIEQFMKAVQVNDPERVSGLSKPDVNYLVTQLNELTKQVNFQQKQNREIYSTSEETISAMKRMHERKDQDTNALKRMVRWVKGDERPENE